ncbi:hypothetical protein M758_11G143700 [Ceratodon purpureus]|nr:hypothetical protein M758_11G143700 [Ceratodon purpureus]
MRPRSGSVIGQSTGYMQLNSDSRAIFKPCSTEHIGQVTTNYCHLHKNGMAAIHLGDLGNVDCRLER